MYEISHMLGNKRGSVLLKFHFPPPLLPPLSPRSPCPARLEQSSRAEPGAAGPSSGTGSGHGSRGSGTGPAPGSAGAHGQQPASLPQGTQGEEKEVSVASASIPGLTRGAPGFVAIPAGCWQGTALGDLGDRAVSHGNLQDGEGSRQSGEP